MHKTGLQDACVLEGSANDEFRRDLAHVHKTFLQDAYALKDRRMTTSRETDLMRTKDYGNAKSLPAAELMMHQSLLPNVLTQCCPKTLCPMQLPTAS